MRKARKEITNVIKKLESRIKYHEKEKINWVKEVSWMEEVQEYNLQKFLVD